MINYKCPSQHNLNIVEEGVRGYFPSSSEISFPAAPQHFPYKSNISLTYKPLQLGNSLCHRKNHGSKATHPTCPKPSDTL
jgi:hypothetical protein